MWFPFVPTGGFSPKSIRQFGIHSRKIARHRIHLIDHRFSDLRGQGSKLAPTGPWKVSASSTLWIHSWSVTPVMLGCHSAVSGGSPDGHVLFPRWAPWSGCWTHWWRAMSGWFQTGSHCETNCRGQRLEPPGGASWNQLPTVRAVSRDRVFFTMDQGTYFNVLRMF